MYDRLRNVAENTNIIRALLKYVLEYLLILHFSKGKKWKRI